MMMNATAARFLRFGVSLSGLLVSGWVLNGQAAKPAEHGIAVPTDWSHRHLVFSLPGSPERLARVSRDPRYRQQILRRENALMLPIATPDLDSSAIGPSMVKRHGENLKRDWAEDMGPGASAGAGNYPAKFSFRGTNANCGDAAMPDYVVYGTGLAGSATQASIVAFDNLYSGCSKLSLGTAANFAVLGSSTVTNAGNTVVTGANIGISPGTSLTGFPPGILTSPAVEHLGDAVASQAQSDANTAYTYFQGLTGATSIGSLDGLTLSPGLYKSAAASLALSARATVTLNGNGIYIFQIGSTLNLAGTVILSGGATAGNVIWLVGSSATLEGTAIAVGDIVVLASITLDSGASLVGRAIALNGAVTLVDNAITTADTVPSVYWAYNTGGQILTSPLISLDGSQVALVQTDTGGVGTLVLIRWAASTGTVGSPVAPTIVLPSAYVGCIAPCMTTVVLHDSSNSTTDDTTSSVFYDYSGDIGWVGGARGWLHKITGVFNGVPTEVQSDGFPVQVSTATPATLSSPVYDSVSRNVFVGDLAGFLYSVDSTNPATVIQSAQLDFGVGIVEGPIVDSANGSVYVFASSDGTTNCTFGTSACAAVYQLSTGFTDGDPGSPATAGTSVASGLTPNPMYIGAFDSTYYASGDGTGNLYVCGNTGQNPAIYQIPISGGVPTAAGAALVGLASASFSPACSPVADVLNPNLTGGAAERLYASVQDNGVATSCGGAGCALNFIVTPWHELTAYQVGQQILDIHLNIEEVTQAGTSGASVPAFSATAGTVKTTDGSVHWINQGALSATPLAIWTPSTAQTKVGNRIVDSNGNVEVVTKTGATGGSVPLWNTSAGGATTSDGTVNWINAGASLIAALPAAGGTSGIIIDNVLNGALAGTSQVYFTTLSDQVCGTSGKGGCAVQASQSGLN
jgi:hypothetical protein